MPLASLAAAQNLLAQAQLTVDAPLPGSSEPSSRMRPHPARAKPTPVWRHRVIHQAAVVKRARIATGTSLQPAPRPLMKRTSHAVSAPDCASLLRSRERFATNLKERVSKKVCPEASQRLQLIHFFSLGCPLRLNHGLLSAV